MSYADRTKRPPRTLSDAEQTKLLKVSGAKRDDFRDHMIFSLALGTGLRESEILALNVGDVMRPDGKPRRTIQLRYYARKGHTAGKKPKPTDDKAQIVHLPDGCYYKLEKYLRVKDSGVALGEMYPDTHLFWSRQKGARLSVRRLREIFREWQTRAGFDQLYNFHELRHTAVTNTYRKTRDIRIAQRVARHARIETTTRYEHASDQEVASAVRGLPS